MEDRSLKSVPTKFICGALILSVIVLGDKEVRLHEVLRVGL